MLSLTLNAISEEKKMTKKEFAASLGVSVYKLKTWTEKYHNFTILDLSLIKEKLGINFDISFSTEKKKRRTLNNEKQLFVEI